MSIKTKIEFKILRYEKFLKNTVYLGIRAWFLGRFLFAVRIPMFFYKNNDIKVY